MKPHVLTISVAAAATLLVAASPAAAQPMKFNEVSLLVRSHESDRAIVQEVSRRKLAQALTPEQEAKLKAQGASESLLQTLRSSVATTAHAERTTANRTASMQRESVAATLHFRATGVTPDDVQIIDVGVDEPVNLSTWGGPDREFVFGHRSITDLSRTYSFYEKANFPYYRDPSAEPTTDEVTMLDPIGSFDHLTNYQNLERRQPYLAEYASRTEHRFTRPMMIQRHNPVHVSGVPYNLYPIYSAGGVSLYYIGRISDNVVRLAVIEWR